MKRYLTQKLMSTKFQCLVAGIVLFILYPKDFTGNNLVILMGVYMGFNTMAKFNKNDKS